MSDRPNIVFILNDHQSYYRHGWDGGPRVRRPQFERLARGGVEFSRAYTACPLCGPARRTMLTGLFPHNHGELKNDTNHPFDRETYLDVLAGAGYECWYYGKWHAGPGTALEHGCRGFSYPSYNNPYTKPEYKAYLERRKLPEPEILIERSFWGPVVGGEPNAMKAGERYRQRRRWCNEHASGVMLTPDDTHEAFFLANLACERLEQLAAAKKPFALRVDFWGPHQPYFPTRRFAGMYRAEEIPEYGSFRDDLSGKPEIYRSEGNAPLHENGKLIVPNPLPWSEWQKVVARAYAQITLVDEAGGRILDALDRLGLADDTLVLWTTDHGDGLACHGGHFDKRSYMPEEMVRVPLAIRFPGRIPAGRTTDALASNIDLAPTFLDAAGLSFGAPVDGRSLLPAAAGKAGDWREDLMCETHGHMEEHIGRLVVSGRWKYVANRGQLDELYDLDGDPYELRNLARDPGHEAVVRDLKARLESWRTRSGDAAPVE